MKTRYPSGEFVTATYDAGMQPLSLSGTSAYVTGATYTAQDQVSRIQLGNGLSARYLYWGIDYFGAPQYQNYGHLRRVCVLPQSSTVDCESDPTNSALRLNFGYNVDKVGNVTIFRDELNLQRQQFNYDPLNRLVAAVPNPLPGQPSLIPDYTETYALNAIGNLTYKSTVGNYAYGAYSPSGRYLPHAVSTAGGNTYAYDNNGNMVRRVEGGVVYSQTWDVENRLTYVSGSNGKWAQYAYDADGVLVRRNTSGQTTAYIGPHYELVNGAAASYYYLGEQRVAMRASGAVYWLHSDHLGSASLATNSSGAAVANSQTRYKPFGQLRFGGSGLPTDRRFTGQRSDESAIGLYDYRARFYDPLLGRFISPDPLVPSAADPQMLNRFSYARNSPMRYTDSTGHWIESAFDIASIIYDVGEIAQNGLNWENGLSLAADIGGLILPGVTGGGLLVRGAAKVLSHAGDTVKAAAFVEDAARVAAGIKKVTKADIVADLASGTRQSKQIAKAIEGGDIKVHILTQKKFEILYKPINKYDEVTYVQAFARQSHIYLRNRAPTSSAMRCTKGPMLSITSINMSALSTNSKYGHIAMASSSRSSRGAHLSFTMATQSRSTSDATTPTYT